MPPYEAEEEDLGRDEFEECLGAAPAAGSVQDPDPGAGHGRCQEVDAVGACGVALAAHRPRRRSGVSYSYEDRAWTTARICHDIATRVLGGVGFAIWDAQPDDGKVEQIARLLRATRHLLILDNAESITAAPEFAQQ
jgi:hypothetical protein